MKTHVFSIELHYLLSVNIYVRAIVISAINKCKQCYIAANFLYFNFGLQLEYKCVFRGLKN